MLYANKQIDKLEKEKSTVKADIQNAAVALQHVRTELAEKEHECSAVYKAYDAEQKQSLRLNQRVETLQKEKDLIGVELMKKNDEIRHVNNRLDIMQIALDRSTNATYFENGKINLINFSKTFLFFLYRRITV